MSRNIRLVAQHYIKINTKKCLIFCFSVGEQVEFNKFCDVTGFWIGRKCPILPDLSRVFLVVFYYERLGEDNLKEFSNIECSVIKIARVFIG